MGHMISSESNVSIRASIHPHESFTHLQIHQFFYTRCVTLLKPIEISFLKQALGISEDDPDAFQSSIEISKSELGKLLKLNLSQNDEKLESVVTILYDSMKVIGQFPFLGDYNKDIVDEKLTLQEFVISVIFFSGRHKNLMDDNFLRLFYMSLALPLSVKSNNSKEQNSSEEVAMVKKDQEEKGDNKSQADTKELIPNGTSKIEDEEVMHKIRVLMDIEPEDPPELKSRKICWSDMCNGKEFEGIEEVALSAGRLHQILAFMLLLNSINKQNHEVMIKQISENVVYWDKFELYSFYLLKYLKIDLSLHDLENTFISYEKFSEGISLILPGFIESNLYNLMGLSIISTFTKAAKSPPPSPLITHEQTQPRREKPIPEFKESKLVSIPFVSYISAILKGINSPIQITPQNIVKLFAGSDAGFSIRSLESKIFKWQAPTLVIVSGKRLKMKTMTTNSRYHKLQSEYPGYFLKSENPLREWQSENDKITYAVLINSPWKHSNKNNFGDEKSVIISVKPHADVFKSVHNAALNGQSIYFNNVGMGLGFGNNQPICKNDTTRRYFPGDVSLTIDANLEFAVFRHLVSNSTSSNTSSTYFERSQHPVIRDQDYEDRFVISDLEVWGIGSSKELEEQRLQWEWENKQAEARQSVNIRSLGEERAFLEMAGLVGNHGQGGSM
ncbi:RTC5 [[Candida] subhashii]|uniref:RTC5 n=1 Tax=[Candida] subhashii TaxID=561895 RepID=A0A8J5QRS0_9ASCO|nr:RTC5 [[Candida] subhashii]KAG7665243.1 RTC5 [[Candida] subhashii]